MKRLIAPLLFAMMVLFGVKSTPAGPPIGPRRFPSGYVLPHRSYSRTGYRLKDAHRWQYEHNPYSRHMVHPDIPHSYLRPSRIHTYTPATDRYPMGRFTHIWSSIPTPVVLFH